MEPVRDTEPPVPAREPVNDDPDRTTDTGTPASAFGLLPDGAGFVAKLGPGLRLGEEFLSGDRVSLENVPQPLPGVTLDTAQWRSNRLTLRGSLAIPHIASGNFTVRVNRQGDATIRGSLRRQIDLPALGNPTLTLGLSEDGQFSGEAEVEGADLLPRSIKRRGATATGSGSFRLNEGKISGSGSAEITYQDLGGGTVNFSFDEGGKFAANGRIRITPPLVDEVTADIAVDEENNLSATATITAGQIPVSVPGLSIGGGSLTIGYNNGTPTGELADFSASYSGLGSVNIESAALDRRARFSGRGRFDFEIPGLNEAGGPIRINNGQVSGSITLGADAFPEGLPVSRPSITASYEDGRLGVSGSATVDLGPAGEGTFSAAYSEGGEFSFGGEVALTIPGMNETTVRVDYANGAIAAEAEIPINTSLLPGLDGTVTVRYAEDRWSGETTLSYTADNGKLSGSITVTVAQTEENTLEIGGSGSVTAQLMPRLQGTLEATILPEGAIDVSGAIEVTEPLELFPEERMERELFRHSQNIPLWAILVAVIRVRAGVRAGVGPGVFRNIRVEGSYTIGSEEADPSFTVSGELYIPAFVEGYVAFGAGLGLDVVLGSLTGGIEAVGTAGIYGAISVVPELSYEDGDWGIEGTATLAAGARLKLGLNAWAEIEALWVTVWSEEWELAEHVMPIGPDLGLQARMSYKFGNPAPPTIEMSSSDIDTESLIQGAMPKDGPPASGAREALENKAEWQGALREQRQTPVPPDVAAQANQTEQPPQPAQQPQQRPDGPPRAGGQGGTNSAPGTPGATPAAEGAANSGAGGPGQQPDAETPSTPDATVTDAERPPASGPRYPGPITIATLDEPPAPQPRTMDDKKEDLNAAEKAAGAISAVVSDTNQFDDYFPAMKRRFGLTSIGYVFDPTRGVQLEININPKKLLSDPISAEILVLNRDDFGIDPASQSKFKSRKTQNLTIKDASGKRTTSPVGTHMHAQVGPDHIEGVDSRGAEKSVGDFYDLFQTTGNTRDKFVRGHLLSWRLGGGADAANLFPITGLANSRHKFAIEKTVEEWVNTHKYLLDYSVTIKVNRVDPDTPAVDATMEAEASPLNTRLKKAAGQKISASIPSISGTEIDEMKQQRFARDPEDKTGDLVRQTQVPDDQILGLPEPGDHATGYEVNVSGTLRTALALFEPMAASISDRNLQKVTGRAPLTGQEVRRLNTMQDENLDGNTLTRLASGHRAVKTALELWIAFERRGGVLDSDSLEVSFHGSAFHALEGLNGEASQFLANLRLYIKASG